MARNTAAVDVGPAEDRIGDDLHDQIRDQLSDFERDIKGVLGSAVVDDDGVALAWTLKGGAHQMVVSTLGSALRQLIGRAGESLDLGRPQRGLLACEKGSLAAYDIPGSDGLVLIVLLDSNANYVDFMVQVRLLVNELTEVVQGGT